MTVAPSAWGIRNTELSKRGYDVSVIYFNLFQKLTFFKVEMRYEFLIRVMENVHGREKLGKGQKSSTISALFRSFPRKNRWVVIHNTARRHVFF